MTRVYVTYSIMRSFEVEDSMSDNDIYNMAEETSIPYDDIDVEIERGV